MIKYILVYVVFTMFLQAQTDIISDTSKIKSEVMPADTALYDVYDMKYMVSQPLKYIIQQGTIGAATAFSLYSIANLTGDIHDEMGIGFMAMPIIGGAIGLITGTVYGIYKGYSDEKTKKDDETFYHKSGKYGYFFGIGSTNTAKKFSLTNAITIKTESAIKEYPEVLALSIEYARWDGTEHRANELKCGIDGKYYFSKHLFFNSFYGLGIGITNGQYWDTNLAQWSLKEQDKHRYFFLYTNIYLGCGFNIFDFLNVNTSVVFEPVNSGSAINPGGFGFNQMFMFKASVGTSIF